MQGPERYLADMGVTLQCAVDSTRAAIIDQKHRILVNHEVYFVADENNLRVFVTEPYKYTGAVTDPVSRTRFQPSAHSPTRSYSGRLFYFESNETAAQFDADPMMYGIPKAFDEPMEQAS